MQEFLELDVIPDDINVIEQRGYEIAAYMARSGKLLADAKYHQDKNGYSWLWHDYRSMLEYHLTRQ